MQSNETRIEIVIGRQFAVVLEPEDGGGFHASCPELRGCHSFGVTQDEAIEHIAQTIGQHLNELVRRFGQTEGILIVPGDNIFPPGGPVPAKTLRAIVADLGMTIEEFLAMADGEQPAD